MKKIILFLAFLGLCTGLWAQTKATQRIALVNLQRSNVVESSRAGQIGLTDSQGNQRYAQYTEIDLVPIGYTPTATGNTQNYSEFVTTASGDIWYIDWQGRGLKIYAAASAGDYDWLEISNNQIPNSIRDSIYTDNYASVNLRYVWPNAQFLAGDSTSINGGNIVVLGNREGRIGFYRLTGPAWSSMGQEGANLTARLGTGTTGFIVQSAAGVSSSQPAGPYRDIMQVSKDSTVRFHDYPRTRNDTNAIVNFLYTDGIGVLRSSPVTELPSGGGGVDTVFDYTELRNYNGEAKCIYVTKTGLSGLFCATSAIFSDNGGTQIIATNTVRYERVYDKSVILVDWFGAIPNDNINDAPAIQNAIDFGQNKTIVFSKGTYKKEGSTPFNINNYEGMIIRGSGDSTVLYSSEPNTITHAFFLIRNSKKVLIERFVIRQNSAVGATGIQLDSCNDVRIQNLQIDSVAWAIYPFFTKNLTIEHCKLYSANRTVLGNTIELQGCESVHVRKNIIQNSTQNWSSSDTKPNGIEVIAYKTTNRGLGKSRHVFIEDNIFKKNAGCSIYGDSLVFVSRNIFDSCAVNSIRCLNNPDEPTVFASDCYISENIISNWGKDGGWAVALISVQNIKFSGNKVFNGFLSTSPTVYFINSKNSVINSNTIFNNQGDGLYFQTDTNCIVSNNIIFNNSGLGVGSRDGISAISGDKCSFFANRIYDDRSTPRQRFGIFIQTGITNSVITDNICTPNSSWGVYTLSTGTNYYNNNIGQQWFVNNNSSTGTRAGTIVPVGATSDRGDNIDGKLRGNTSTSFPEMYLNGAWRNMAEQTTILDGTTIDLTLTGVQITAEVKNASIQPNHFANISGSGTQGWLPWWNGASWSYSDKIQTPYFIQTATGTISASSNTVNTVVNPGSTQATMTVSLHPAGTPADGQEVALTFVNEITALTVQSNGSAAVLGAPTTTLAGRTYKFKYYASVGASGTWILQQ